MEDLKFQQKNILTVISSKVNHDYIEFKKLIEKPDIVDKLKEMNIVVLEDLRNDIKNFVVYLYDFSAQPILSFNSFTADMIDQIKKILSRGDNNDASKKPIANEALKGGKEKSENYKLKYMKYKKKYIDMKNVITKYY